MKSPIFAEVNEKLKEHLKFPMQKELEAACAEVARIFNENKNAMAMAFAAETGCDPRNVVMVTQGARMWFEERFDPETHAVFVTKDGLKDIFCFPVGQNYRIARPVRASYSIATDSLDTIAPSRMYERTGEKEKGLWVFREV